jgi:Haem-binding uptake, Tiki superfamily, ChaN
MQSLRPARNLRSRRYIAAPLLVSLCACTSSATHRDWQSRFSGDAIVMLGEVHDNAEQHQLRLERLRQAFAEGWRPVIAMEQFDREH